MRYESGLKYNGSCRNRGKMIYSRYISCKTKRIGFVRAIMNCGLAWEVNIVSGGSFVYGLVVRLLFLKLGMFVIVS